MCVQVSLREVGTGVYNDEVAAQLAQKFMAGKGTTQEVNELRLSLQNWVKDRPTTTVWSMRDVEDICDEANVLIAQGPGDIVGGLEDGDDDFEDGYDDESYDDEDEDDGAFVADVLDVVVQETPIDNRRNEGLVG